MEGDQAGSQKGWFRENWFRLGILVVLLVVAYVLYQALVVNPRIKQAQIEAQSIADKVSEESRRAEEEGRRVEAENNISSCLTSASLTYSNNWNQSCKAKGLLSPECELFTGSDGYNEYKKIHPEAEIDVYLKARDECSCRLPQQDAERWDNSLSDEKENCYRRYSMN